MRTTLKAIRKVIEQYNKEQNHNWIVQDSMVRNLKQIVEEELAEAEDFQHFVTEAYEELLLECEHEDYSVEDDECVIGCDIHGDPQYQGYHYKICNICGATCSFRAGTNEDETIEGEWER